MRDWEPHICQCGLKLINLRGMPRFGIIWAISEDDLAVYLKGEQPSHDIYIYKGKSLALIPGKCH